MADIDTDNISLFVDLELFESYRLIDLAGLGISICMEYGLWLILSITIIATICRIQWGNSILYIRDEGWRGSAEYAETASFFYDSF